MLSPSWQAPGRPQQLHAQYASPPCAPPRPRHHHNRIRRALPAAAPAVQEAAPVAAEGSQEAFASVPAMCVLACTRARKAAPSLASALRRSGSLTSAPTSVQQSKGLHCRRWERLAEQHGGGLACVEPHNKQAADLTYAEVHEHMRHAAAGLVKLGLAPKDKVRPRHACLQAVVCSCRVPCPPTPPTAHTSSWTCCACLCDRWPCLLRTAAGGSSPIRPSCSVVQCPW